MSVLDGPGEGTWSVFAAKVVEERDALRDHIKSLEAQLECAQAFHNVALRERDLAITQLRHAEADVRAQEFQTGLVAQALAGKVAKTDAVNRLLSQNGCDCECDHDAESHDDTCERCLACRIDAALNGKGET